MAKVIGPLFSLDAYKSVGKAITIQRRPSGHSIMKPPRPSRKSLDEPSDAQQIQRDKITDLVDKWINLPQVCKEYWQYSAKLLHYDYSGYHFFMKNDGQPQVLISQLFDKWSDLINGLVLFYSFDGSPSGTIEDLSGNNNIGILKPSYPTDSPLKITSQNFESGQSLQFDGINDWVYFPTAHSFKNNLQGSYCFWFKVNSIPTSNKMIFHSGNNRLDVNIEGNNGKIFVWFTASNNIGYLVFKSSGSQYSDGKWHFIVVNKTSTRINVYIDNVNVGGYNTTLNTYGDYINGAIGATFLGSLCSNVCIDELRIYNRALTIDEIKKLYYLYSM